jgi:hypothetical protein
MEYLCIAQISILSNDGVVWSYKMNAFTSVAVIIVHISCSFICSGHTLLPTTMTAVIAASVIFHCIDFLWLLWLLLLWSLTFLTASDCYDFVSVIFDCIDFFSDCCSCNLWLPLLSLTAMTAASVIFDCLDFLWLQWLFLWSLVFLTSSDCSDCCFCDLINDQQIFIISHGETSSRSCWAPFVVEASIEPSAFRPVV